MLRMNGYHEYLPSNNYICLDNGKRFKKDSREWLHKTSNRSTVQVREIEQPLNEIQNEIQAGIQQKLQPDLRTKVAETQTDFISESDEPSLESFRMCNVNPLYGFEYNNSNDSETTENDLVLLNRNDTHTYQKDPEPTFWTDSLSLDVQQKHQDEEGKQEGCNPLCCPLCPPGDVSPSANGLDISRKAFSARDYCSSIGSPGSQWETWSCLSTNDTKEWLLRGSSWIRHRKKRPMAHTEAVAKTQEKFEKAIETKLRSFIAQPLETSPENSNDTTQTEEEERYIGQTEQERYDCSFLGDTNVLGQSVFLSPKPLQQDPQTVLMFNEIAESQGFDFTPGRELCF